MLRQAVDAAFSPSDHSALQKPLEQFRATAKRLVIHPTEMKLLWVVSLNLVLLPWSIGGMRLWSQIPSLFLSALSLMLALLPRHYTEEHTGSNRFRLVMWPKLLRFPIFWLGLGLLALVAIQALNPAWEYRTDGKVWWMRKIEYISWLPSSVDVPIQEWGPWRMFMIYASVWLTLCSIWVGFTRRRTLKIVLTAVVVNGILLALLGIVQKLVPTTKMFWFWEPPRDAGFFSSFVYKNHGAAYLDLTLFAAFGLSAWYYLRGIRRLEKSNSAGLWAFFATCIAIAVMVSYARGATIVMLAFLCIAVAAFLLHQFLTPNPIRRRVVMVMMACFFGYFLKTGLEALDFGEAWNRLRSGITEQDNSLSSRRVARAASAELLRHNWQLGIGAGGFRYLFPSYQRQHSEIWALDGRRMYWEHAHSDPIEIAAEFGLPGLLLLLAGTAFGLVFLVKNYAWQNPLASAITAGCGLLIVYSWWDFPLFCPAILHLLATLLVIAGMWAAMEERKLRE